jgi:DNA-binding FadR family transcriptional regulator
MLDDAQMRQFEMADISFHTFLMSIAGNAVALKFFGKVRYLIRVFAARHAGHDAEALARIHKEHLDMIQAMADGDVNKGVQAVSRHIQASRQERLKEYSYWEREALLRTQIQDFFHDKPGEEVIGN